MISALWPDADPVGWPMVSERMLSSTVPEAPHTRKNPLKPQPVASPMKRNGRSLTSMGSERMVRDPMCDPLPKDNHSVSWYMEKSGDRDLLRFLRAVKQNLN